MSVPLEKMRCRLIAATAAALMLAGADPQAMAASAPAPALMSRKDDKCDVPFETATTLVFPAYGAPSLWSATYNMGPRKSISFAAGYLTDGGNVAALGTRSGEGEAPREVFLVEMNRRGLVMRDRSFPDRKGDIAIDLAPLAGGGGVMLSGAGPEKAARLVWLNKEWSPGTEIRPSESGYTLEGRSLTALKGGDILAVFQAVPKAGGNDRYAVIDKYDASGRRIWRRAFSSGAENGLASVAEGADGTLIAAGYTRLDGGGTGGYALALGADGSIIWQRAFPKGAGADFQRGAVMGLPPGSDEAALYFLAGRAVSGQTGARRGWLLALNGRGDPIWSRLASVKGYEAGDAFIVLGADRQIGLAINSLPLDGAAGGKHVDMFAFSLRGKVTRRDSYLSGQAAQANDFFVSADGSPYFIGESLPSTAGDAGAAGTVTVAGLGGNARPAVPSAAGADGTEDGTQIGPSRQARGWIMSLKPIPPYAEPCPGK